MAELGKRLAVILFLNVVAYGIACGCTNMMNGKTFMGRTKKAKKERNHDDTYVDWKGNVHLGTDDYQVY